MRGIRKAITVVGFFAATAASSASADVHRLTVRDAEFKVIAELSQKAELQQFEQHWSQKSKTNQTSAQLHDSTFMYKLDIDAGPHGGRWLYNPNGLVVKLDKRVRPVYRIQKFKVFNELVGLPHL